MNEVKMKLMMANNRPISYTAKVNKNGEIVQNNLKGLGLMKITPINNIATPPRKTLRHSTFDSDIGICIKNEKEEPSVKSSIISD